MTIDKQTALQRLASIENEAQELRKIIEAPEPAKSLLSKPEPGSERTYWVVNASAYDGEGIHRLTSVTREACSNWVQLYKHGNFFQSPQLAKDYALAIDTLLLLRHQPGTEPAIDGDRQWLVLLDWPLKLVASSCRYSYFKQTQASPCFKTEQYAKQAIETVGKDRLMHMFNTFHHVED